MEMLDTNFTEKIPSFNEFVNENYPAGAAHDQDAPWNVKQPDSWNITSVTYDEKEGDIVFGINGNGYPNEIRIWSGENLVIDEIDPKLDLSENELDVKLQELVSKMNSDKNEIPVKIIEYITGELDEKHDDKWAEDAADERFERTHDDF